MPVIDPEIQDFALKHLSEKLRDVLKPMAFVNIANASAVAVTFSGMVAWQNIALWYTPIIMFALFQIRAANRLNQIDISAIRHSRFLKRAEVSSIILGFGWGMSCFALGGHGTTADIMLYSICLGMCAGTAAISAALCGIAARFMLGVAMPTIAAPFISGSPFALTVLVLGSALVISLIFASVLQFDNTLELLKEKNRSDKAHASLVEAIETRSDAFAVFDRGGQPVVSNTYYNDWVKSEGLDPYRMTHGESLLPSGRWVMHSVRETALGSRVSVHTDITTLKERERELIAARSEAEQADEAKSRFLSTMSHELRTPLNIILGFAKLMTEDSRIKLHESDVRNYAQNICQSGDHLLSLINDIIDYSKIGLDKYLIQCEPVDVTQLLINAKSTAEAFQSINTPSNIEIRIDPKMGDLLVDQVAAQRIVLNLLTNALKFAGNQSRILLRAGLTGDGNPYISVRDFGPGIPEDRLEQVFQAFYQIDNGTARQNGGTGLGLTLSRHMARLHGGDLKLKTHEGHGLTSAFILPTDAHLSRTPQIDAGTEAA